MSQKEVARAVAFRFQRISTDSQRRLPTVGKANDYQWILSADFFFVRSKFTWSDAEISMQCMVARGR
jgi:hypothetical protein